MTSLGVKTRGKRVVGLRGRGFIVDEIAHGLWDAGKKVRAFAKQEEAKRAEKVEAFNKRMAEIDRNNPFPKNDELAKQLGYGFFDDIKGGLESAANWADDNINPLAAIARRLGGNIQSATRFGRGTTGLRAGEEIGDMFARMRREDQEAKKKLQDAKDSKAANAQRLIDEYRNSAEGKKLFGFGLKEDLEALSKKRRMTDDMPYNDISGWIEKERRSTGYYGKPAILGEGM